MSTGTAGFRQDVVLLIRPEGMPFMLKSLKSTSTSLILLGTLAVIVGIIAIAWPNVTILALVILFAVYAFMDAGLQAARAFSSRQADQREQQVTEHRPGLAALKARAACSPAPRNA